MPYGVLKNRFALASLLAMLCVASCDDTTGQNDQTDLAQVSDVAADQATADVEPDTGTSGQSDVALDAGTDQTDVTLNAPTDRGDTLSDLPDTADMSGDEPDADLPLGPFENEAGGNPLVPELAAYPFPCDFYLSESEDTLTGRFIDLTDEILPTRLKAEMFADMDGFSRTPVILTLLPGGFDPTSLPSPVDHGESISPDASVMLVEEDTWALVPALVELDLTTDDTARQALIVRSLVALEPDTGYVVIIRNSVRRLDGMPHEAAEPFRALRDGLPTVDEAIEAQRDDFVLVNDAIAGLELDPESVVLAWSFHTRSEEQVVSPLLAMQQHANTAPMGDYEITEETDDGTNTQFVGTFEVPNFASPESGDLVLDEDGRPTVFGARDVEFVLTIPNVINEPRPLLIYGHGFFSSKWESTRGGALALAATQGYSIAAVDFGFHGGLQPLLLEALSVSPAKIVTAVTEVLQTFVNTTFLTRLVKERLATDLTGEDADGGTTELIDPTRIHYVGGSNGGTFGYVQAATSPQIELAVLAVGGGGIIHFLERAVQWGEYGEVFAAIIPDPAELQLFFSLGQHLLDPIDAMNYAAHLVTDRFPGLPPIKASVHMSLYDSQVANLVTEWVIRTAGIPMVVPSAKEVWGLETLDASLPDGAPDGTLSAFYVYNHGDHVAPTPVGNLPPMVDNGVHANIINLDSFLIHTIRFLDEGIFVNVCDGPCDPD